MDVIDRASQEEENILKANIAAAKRKTFHLEPKGNCWFCDEKIEGAKLFCDQDCSCDYEREQSQLRRSGLFKE